MSSKTRTNKRSRRGVATVEMAMVAPVIFLLIFGSIEFSRMMMIRQALTNAARDGCRNACLITTRDDSNPKWTTRDALRGVVASADDTDLIRINFNPEISAMLKTGDTISVTVEVDCSDVSWLPPFFTAGARIRGTASMKRE